MSFVLCCYYFALLLVELNNLDGGSSACAINIWYLLLFHLEHHVYVMNNGAYAVVVGHVVVIVCLRCCELVPFYCLAVGLVLCACLLFFYGIIVGFTDLLASDLLLHFRLLSYAA